MTTETTKTEYIIDATGKRLGNLATDAAAVLLGKQSTQYTRHLTADVTVIINNASKMDISEKKRAEIFQRYSGYPGGLKSETLVHLGTRRGYSEVVRRTVSGMIPNNKLKKPRLKKLIITE